MYTVVSIYPYKAVQLQSGAPSIASVFNHGKPQGVLSQMKYVFTGIRSIEYPERIAYSTELSDAMNTPGKDCVGRLFM